MDAFMETTKINSQTDSKNIMQSSAFIFIYWKSKNIILNKPLILAQRGLLLIVNIMANNPHEVLK